MKNLDFGHGHGQNFDHMTIVISKFWPWSWSKIFDHMTMTPARRPYGQKIMVALPPPKFENISEYFVLDKHFNCNSVFKHVCILCKAASRPESDCFSPGIQLTAPSEEPQQVPVVQPMQIHPDLQKQLKLHQEEQLLCGQEKNEEEEEQTEVKEEEEEEVQGEQEEDNQACDEVSNMLGLMVFQFLVS